MHDPLSAEFPDNRLLNRVFWATRSEGRYAGILVPDDAGLKLTRGVYFKTIAACSRFVFDTTETAIWQSPDDFGDWPTQ